MPLSMKPNFEDYRSGLLLGWAVLHRAQSGERCLSTVLLGCSLKAVVHVAVPCIMLAVMSLHYLC